MSNQESYQLQVHLEEKMGYEETDVQIVMTSNEVDCQLQEVGIKGK